LCWCNTYLLSCSREKEVHKQLGGCWMIKTLTVSRSKDLQGYLSLQTLLR
jgi:hypothetical protein